MNHVLIRSAIFGGIIVFLWGLISWTLLPWHQATIKHFQNEESVAQVIRENAFERGMYFLPNMMSYNSKEVQDVVEQRVEEGREKVAHGPVMFAAIQPLGVNPNMAGAFFASVLINIIGAYLIAWIVSLISTHFWGRVGCITLFGVMIGLLGLLPFWNWWYFSLSYVVIGMLDYVISWFFAGLVIAQIQEKRR